jgi:hypothetical protein
MNPYRKPADRPADPSIRQIWEPEVAWKERQGRRWGVVIGLVFLGLALFAGSCTPVQREGARTVLSITETLCIIAHQTMPDTDVAKACGIADGFFGPMRDILSSSREASARAAAQARTSACSQKPDGGVP